jgi:hypothetical protein
LAEDAIKSAIQDYLRKRRARAALQGQRQAAEQAAEGNALHRAEGI